jgi:hypothetical protein
LGSIWKRSPAEGSIFDWLGKNDQPVEGRGVDLGALRDSTSAVVVACIDIGRAPGRPSEGLTLGPLPLAAG